MFEYPKVSKLKLLYICLKSLGVMVVMVFSFKQNIEGPFHQRKPSPLRAKPSCKLLASYYSCMNVVKQIQN
jgi:hypothetical protein